MRLIFRNKRAACLGRLSEGLIRDCIVCFEVSPALDVSAIHCQEPESEALRVHGRDVVDHREVLARVPVALL